LNKAIIIAVNFSLKVSSAWSLILFLVASEKLFPSNIAISIKLRNYSTFNNTSRNTFQYSLTLYSDKALEAHLSLKKNIRNYMLILIKKP